MINIIFVITIIIKKLIKILFSIYLEILKIRFYVFCKLLRIFLIMHYIRWICVKFKKILHPISTLVILITKLNLVANKYIKKYTYLKKKIIRFCLIFIKIAFLPIFTLFFKMLSINSKKLVALYLKEVMPFCCVYKRKIKRALFFRTFFMRLKVQLRAIRQIQQFVIRIIRRCSIKIKYI